MKNFKKQKFYRLYLLLVVFVCVVGCNVTKNIPANDALYTGAKVDIKKTGVGSKQKKAIQTDLGGLVRPKPNSKILGIPLKLMLHNLGGAKQKGLGGWLSRKFGEPPVLVSSVNLDRNVLILDNHLENRGFFHAQVSGDTSIKAKKASATSSRAGATCSI
jgi:hypothetical protein